MSERIPEGWTKIKLGNIGKFSTSSVDKKSVEGEQVVSLLNYMDVYRHSILSEKYPFHKVTAPSKQISSASVQDGDVFFTPSSETPDDIGYSAVFIGNAKDTVHSYHTVRYRLSSKKHLDKLFTAYAFKGEVTEKYFQKRATGSTRFTISLPIFNDLEIIVPPLLEQKKIASILTSVDEVIKNTQKQINKLQDLKKATMNELLTKGIGHTEFKDSELGRIPKNWDVKAIIDSRIVVLDGDRGRFYPKENEFFEQNFCLFLSAKNVTKDGFRFGENLFITKEKHEQMGKGGLERGDIVITTRGTIGNFAHFSASIPYSFIRINSGMAIIRNREESLKTDFLFLSLGSELMNSQVKFLTFGSAQPQLTIGTLNELKIPVPPLTEQEKIVKIITATNSLLQEKKKKLHQTQSLKKSLMQDLLTGKVRVKVN